MLARPSRSPELRSRRGRSSSPTGSSIEVHTASFRTVRGYTVCAALLDEIAFWRSEESANPDTRDPRRRSGRRWRRSRAPCCWRPRAPTPVGAPSGTPPAPLRQGRPGPGLAGPTPEHEPDDPASGRRRCARARRGGWRLGVRLAEFRRRPRELRRPGSGRGLHRAGRARAAADGEHRLRRLLRPERRPAGRDDPGDRPQGGRPGRSWTASGSGTRPSIPGGVVREFAGTAARLRSGSR